MYRGQKIDKLLANYLAHEEEEEGARYDNGPDDDVDDIYGPEDRKRSVFRERDGKYLILLKKLTLKAFNFTKIFTNNSAEIVIYYKINKKKG